MWVQSANPLPFRVPVSSCQNQESCSLYSNGAYPPSLRKVPVLDANLHLNNEVTQLIVRQNLHDLDASTP